MINVLIFGNSSAEDSIAWKLNNENDIKNIFIFPGNGGYFFKSKARNIELNLNNKKILKECIIRIEKQGVTALSGGAMFQKLLEISSGFVYDDNNNTIVIDDLKMRTIVECIQNELCNKQVVIFYNFNGEAEILKRFLSSYRHISSQTSEKERSEIISEFKSRLFNILLAHSRTMGIGVNLQNAYAIIWVSPPTSLETFQQANARVYRSGYQGKKVPCFLFTTNQLLDKKVYKALQNKEQVQKKFLELIKNSI